MPIMMPEESSPHDPRAGIQGPQFAASHVDRIENGQPLAAAVTLRRLLAAADPRTYELAFTVVFITSIYTCALKRKKGGL